MKITLTSAGSHQALEVDAIRAVPPTLDVNQPTKPYTHMFVFVTFVSAEVKRNRFGERLDVTQLPINLYVTLP